MIGTLALGLAPNALATSGHPVLLATPYSSTTPSVAVDANGTAYIAWANQKRLAPTTTDLVEFCVLPHGASACSAHGSLAPANGGTYVSDVSVVLDGSTVALLAETPGVPNSAYTGIEEWQSTDGGITFAPVNGGKSVAYSTGSTASLNGVVLPGGGALGIGWVAAAGQPSFNAFPLSAPPECSQNSCPSGSAMLEPTSNPDPIGNPPGQVASQLGSNPGVMAIFATNFQNGPFACSNAQTVPFGEAYAYASGTPSPTNDYNISPGTANSAWKVAASKADCNVDYAAVAGGPSGFGILEQNELSRTVVCHRFNQANNSFDTPQVTVAKHGEESPALSQDGAGNLYATYLNHGPGDPIDLAYSGNGGASWISAPINASPGSDVFNVASAVGSGGQGWASWVTNGSIYAQSFIASDAIPSPTPVTINTSQAAGTLAGVNLIVPVGTIGETDHATVAGSDAGSATGTIAYKLYSAANCAAASPIFRSWRGHGLPVVARAAGFRVARGCVAGCR
ncbi:MAG: hypothetical protein ACYDHH_15100 [Solirubrobacteraceae bacterium]